MNNSRKFTLISWSITLIIIAALLGSTLLWTQNVRSAAALPAPEPTSKPDNAAAVPVSLPALDTSFTPISLRRAATLKTIIPERPRYDIQTYTVHSGDSVFAIAKEFGIKPETLLWANYDTLQDDPHAIKVGQRLRVPPTDGVLYQWKEDDTVEKVADEFDAQPQDILTWPGNHVDLTNPHFEPDQWVMVPGGHREFVQWLIPTVARGSSGTANVGGSACGAGGAVGSGAFVWPANNHYLSGNDYWAGHLGIDIAAGLGAPIYAADSGVVTMAAGGYNHGYGNVIMIDHGNGYVTLYAHLSQINVGVCQSVYAGQLIGLAGSTGNSTGPHLHFEVRLNGGFINPWYVLPPP